MMKPFQLLMLDQQVQTCQMSNLDTKKVALDMDMILADVSTLQWDFGQFVHPMKMATITSQVRKVFSFYVPAQSVLGSPEDLFF